MIIKDEPEEIIMSWSAFLSPLPPSLTLSLLSLFDCHSTFMTGLSCVPKTSGARQDGRRCPGNRMESGRRE